MTMMGGRGLPRRPRAAAVRSARGRVGTCRASLSFSRRLRSPLHSMGRMQHDGEDHQRMLAMVVAVGPAVHAAGQCTGNESHGRLAEEDGRGGGGEGNLMRPDAPSNLKNVIFPTRLSLSL
jgi:hypothetical protein